MYIKILYDSEAEKGLIGDWGFSCLVGDETLFDTGSDAAILRHNIRQLGVDLSRVRRVVISHQHDDHVGGIDVLGDLGDVEVYVPGDLPEELMNRLGMMSNVKVVVVSKKEEIAPGIWTTGEIEGEVREQALVVRTERGITLVSGCLHKGFRKALDVALGIGEAYGMVGGQHDIEERDMEGFSVIVPCHCTKNKTSMHLSHPEQVRLCKVGLVIEI